jgi:hypothetical protein
MEELIHRIEQVAAETEFSGVVSIFRDGSLVFSQAVEHPLAARI